MAVAMHDYNTADKVMAAKRARVQKRLGREVKNFDENRWNDICKDIVKRGNIAKVCMTNCT